MTSREAAIVMAYTGYVIGDVAAHHAYVEELFGRPVQTLEMSTDAFARKLQDLARSDFIAIEVAE